MYTEYYRVHTQGGTLFRPKFFRWENDQELYKAPEESLIYGNAIMMQPILEK